MQPPPPPPSGQIGPPPGFGAPPKPGGDGNWWIRLPRWSKWTIGIVALLVIVGAAVGDPEEQSGDQAAQTTTDGRTATTKKNKADKSAEDKPETCGTKATDDCTPHVGPGGSVRVDALTWKIVGAESTSTIGDQEFGLGSKADGVFVVVSLQVTSAKSESATLTDNAFQLEVNGKTYDPDNEGTVAAVGAGEEPFFLEDIGPDSTVTGKVVFDVPQTVLSNKPEMRFNELGFGSTHAYIRLPSL